MKMSNQITVYSKIMYKQAQTKNTGCFGKNRTIIIKAMLMEGRVTYHTITCHKIARTTVLGNNERIFTLVELYLLHSLK